MSLFYVCCAILAGTALLVSGIAVITNVSLSLDGDGGNGVLLHPGWRPYSPYISLLIEDMRKNPGNYQLDQHTMKSEVVNIWVANGWAFYKDYAKMWGTEGAFTVGPFSVFDRTAFHYEFKRLKARSKNKVIRTTPFEFEMALRRSNAARKG